MSDQNDKLKQLKTSSMDRRLSIAKASLLAGTRWAASSASTMFSSEEEKERKRKKAMKEQAEYLVAEIGKLKGSIVKIGQMMALYGEHFLPEEITQALNTLNNQTVALAWPAIKTQLEAQLGSKLNDLTIDHEPLGTASLAQVHRATRKSDGLELVLKVQYPGVADAIDSDMNLFKNMLKLTRMVPQTREFDQWFEEVREMMHREVNYKIEADTTRRFASRLNHDPRYIVPQIVDDYCTHQVLCMTFERGVPINSPVMLSLPQERRNALGEASLEIAVREIFEWGEMQTDPNFGNYLVRLGDGAQVQDKIVLLDFGAIRQFDSNLLKVARNLIEAGYHHDAAEMVEAMTGYEFFDAMPLSIKPDMAKVFLLATEAFSSPLNNPDLPAGVMDEHLRYDWKKSQLHSRVMQRASKSMASRYFSIPPKEFMFISRKFIGAYTFMTVIEAKTNVRNMIQKYQ
ncbi:AarF/ABC1/UbiB kinase family protein [Acinetobacter cumulans]|uniref:AarF/ABC1/UbiB kinase family protein n=1 Tax=Acinetobacter cumulans TaxID=2136182 RepID=A0A3A8G7N7_9GAMM|nr:MULTISPECIES: AarF/ABC1/UbiB kinase family protein [Acinetobacter]NWK75429.1 AarF/ABC1/UbiB kinase family protein [Acinetobacter sp. SwsAc6]QCO21990.1 AarF/ABC1/UbiB kinase family protein [Acinetobacter cumulans]RKG47464.1 AarF/ABC1/UbiB kinase family protein [Acinetobacter cumulans]RKG55087.1 AarF/ABC1/UbiB kinase family protein [Acinetobacter cumulans]RLL36168.1 AarF/ABC1/UbiB kinase family protein [Acinetobacter cumulans]